jgi:hypothetical protein
MPGLEDVEDVVARSMGAMSNALVGGMYQLPNQMACCTANGVQGFYYGWEAAIRHRAGTSTVNLFFTRFSPWLDLISWLPYEGRVVINNKTSKAVNVRIPGWVMLGDVRVTVNGNDVTPDYAGRYARLSGLAGGERIELTFPQPRRSLKITVPHYNDRPWWCRGAVTVNLVGSTATGFEESGAENLQGAEPVMIKLFEYPGYYKHYRSGELAMKEADYYVAEKTIKWY